MNDRNIETLARYNSEKTRGIGHTDDWVYKMALLQDQWDWENHTGIYMNNDVRDTIVEDSPDDPRCLCGITLKSEDGVPYMPDHTDKYHNKVLQEAHIEWRDGKDDGNAKAKNRKGTTSPQGR